MTSFDSTYDLPWGPGPRGERKRRRHHHHGDPRALQAVLAAHHRGGPEGFDESEEFGPGRGFGGPFGPGARGPFGRGGRGGRGGRRARRGDVRLAALLLIAEEPRNGYAIMQELEQRSGGVWRPSPGSVYPALSQLEDEGLIRSREADGGRVFELTDAGQAQVAERPQDAPAPWETVGQNLGDDVRALMGQVRQLAVATTQVAQSGNTEQARKAAEVLDQARRSIYRILADGDAGEQPEA
jgi:DNA-binding PadR family transcriptional regulator